MLLTTQVASKWFLNALIVLIFLGGCSLPPEPIKSAPTLAISPISQPTPTNAIKNGPESPKDLYIEGRTASIESYYGLFRLSSHCLLDRLPCKIELIPDFPGSDIQSPLQWSPNGQFALFYDSSKGQLFKFTPLDGKFSVITSDLALIQNEIRWNPEGNLAAIVMYSRDFSCDIGIVDPEAHTIKKIAEGLDGVANILGWTKDNGLLISLNHFGDFSTNPKGAVTKVSLSRMNPQNGKLEDLALNINWLEKSFLTLSPDGNYLAYTNNNAINSPLLSFNLNNSSELALVTPRMAPHWSPDSNWIAGVVVRTSNQNPSYDLFIIHPNGKGSRKLMTSTAYPSISWLPDSNHLLASYMDDSTKQGYVDLISIVDNTIETFPLELDEYPIIVEISFQPSKK